MQCSWDASAKNFRIFIEIVNFLWYSKGRGIKLSPVIKTVHSVSIVCSIQNTGGTETLLDQTLASFWAIQFISIRGFPECSYKRFAISVIPPYLLAIAPCTEIRILESWKRLVVGSGIREMFAYGTRNTTQGIRNPIKECNPESKFHWQYSVSSTWN